MNEPLTVCTAVSKNYLAHARALAEGLKKHNPGAELWVLLGDTVDGRFDPAKEPFRMIGIDDLSDSKSVREMAHRYTPIEFFCAVRGYLHEYMFEKSGRAKWFFMDADIMVFSSLQELWNELDAVSGLLSPHRLSPAPDELAQPESVIARCGIFNGGFLGLRKTEAAKRFIVWFRDRLRDYCINGNGLYMDQSWINFVPVYFPEIKWTRHPGANIGHWNVFEKKLSKDAAGCYEADGKPFLFAHFSGWQMERPEEVSEYVRHIPMTVPLWKELGVFYKAALKRNGHEECRKWPYAFERNRS